MGNKGIPLLCRIKFIFVATNPFGWTGNIPIGKRISKKKSLIIYDGVNLSYVTINEGTEFNKAIKIKHFSLNYSYLGRIKHLG